MDRTEPDWTFWRRDELSIHDAACLLCNIEPIEAGVRKNSSRYEEWQLFRKQIEITKADLIAADLVREKEKIDHRQTSPQTRVFDSIDPNSDGWDTVTDERNWGGVTTIQKTVIQYIRLNDLFTFARENGRKAATRGLCLEPEDDHKYESSLPTTLHKLVLGMAISKYGYDMDSTERQEATGTGNNSITRDLDKLGIPLDKGTIRTALQNAANKEWQKTNKLNRSNESKTLHDWIIDN